MTTRSLHRRIAELVAAACDGQLSADEAEQAESLAVAGVGSLETLRIIDAVEREFGIALEIDDPVHLDSVAALADRLAAQGLPAPLRRIEAP